ncbi:ribosomal protein L21-like protein [Xylariomycetidae sp. FL0641]|nr:ribosomal protein L21-like protein [Xylariomycetidae sp. FL0641]
MSRSLLRSVLGLQTPLTRLPPSFLLPTIAQTRRAISTTPQHIDPIDPATTPSTAATQSTILPTGSAAARPHQPPRAQHRATAAAAAAHAFVQDEASVRQLLPLLRAQPRQYITVHIHGVPYLVTPGDAVRLPFLMHGVLPGDVLRLDRASVLGSRDYTLKGAPYIDPALFECRAVVTGVDTEPLRVVVKTKRRNRRAQRVKSKHRFTTLRISEVKVLGPE